MAANAIINSVVLTKPKYPVQKNRPEPALGLCAGTPEPQVKLALLAPSDMVKKENRGRMGGSYLSTGVEYREELCHEYLYLFNSWLPDFIQAWSVRS